MSRRFEIYFEETAEASLEFCEHFLIDQLAMSLDDAQTISLHLIDTATDRLSDHAATYAICRQAAALGTHHYRELLIDNYRVVYRIWPETHAVSIYLFAHQRQDFKQLLFQYQMLM
ncbi:type II toxin-antitoxin system RelE/ParE family toxin [Halomonas sp. GXIMD04776]|uniref:type II toxin-antitoxin system RelE/ParE family toxin n=1 Tax=Halomonas sp. GXIMD04776 TaxID=3415605 RepID=UPI003CBF649D